MNIKFNVYFKSSVPNLNASAAGTKLSASIIKTWLIVISILIRFNIIVILLLWILIRNYKVPCLKDKNAITSGPEATISASAPNCINT